MFRKKGTFFFPTNDMQLSYVFEKIVQHEVIQTSGCSICDSVIVTGLNLVFISPSFDYQERVIQDLLYCF